MALNAKYFRHRLYPRLRYAARIPAFLTAEASALSATAISKSGTPVRTVNTKAEGLVTISGGSVASNDFVEIGGRRYTFKTALTEVLAARTLTNDATDVTANDTVTIDGKTYTFKSSLTEVKAANSLTTDNTNTADTSTVVVNGKTYTFQTTLTNVDGHIHIGTDADTTLLNLARAINGSGGTAGTDYAAANVAHTTVSAATSVTAHAIALTAKTAGVAGNAYTLALAGTTHLTVGAATFSGGVNPVANEVKRGVSATASMTALFEAINAGAAAGTDYSSNTVAHTTVTATNPTSATVIATAKAPGTAGNSIAVSETSTHLAWAGATLTGGVNAVVDEVLLGNGTTDSRDNLIKAINHSATEGTNYSTGTVINAQVVASASSANVLLTAGSVANVPGFAGMNITLAKSGAHITVPARLDGPAWTFTGHGKVEGEGPFFLTNSGGALPAGSPAAATELYVHVIDTNTLALAAGREPLRKGNFIQTTDAGSGTHSIARGVTAQSVFDTIKRGVKPRTVAAASDIDGL